MWYIELVEMKKTAIILSLFALLAGGCSSNQKTIAKIQPKDLTKLPSSAITLESFLGGWSREIRLDVEIRSDVEDEEGVIEKDVLFSSFELFLEKDGTKENSLKGWHCAIIRGGRQADCDDYDDDAPVHGYLKNDTVYLHFVNNWDDEVEAKLYFDKSARNLSAIIWELGRYEPKLRHFFAEKDTLQKVIGKIPK